MQRSETGLGYVYYRDRSRGYDITVYEHQLVALLEHEPADVFHADSEVHHQNRIRLDNRRENLELLNGSEHAAVTNVTRAASDD